MSVDAADIIGARIVDMRIDIQMRCNAIFKGGKGDTHHQSVAVGIGKDMLFNLILTFNIFIDNFIGKGLRATISICI